MPLHKPVNPACQDQCFACTHGLLSKCRTAYADLACNRATNLLQEAYIPNICFAFYSSQLIRCIGSGHAMVCGCKRCIDMRYIPQQTLRSNRLGQITAQLPLMCAGNQGRLPRPSSGRIQKRTSSGSKSNSRPNSRGQAGQSSKSSVGTAKLKQLASNRASQELRRRGNKV